MARSKKSLGYYLLPILLVRKDVAKDSKTSQNLIKEVWFSTFPTRPCKFCLDIELLIRDTFIMHFDGISPLLRTEYCVRFPEPFIPHFYSLRLPGINVYYEDNYNFTEICKARASNRFAWPPFFVKLEFMGPRSETLIVTRF